MRGISFKIPNEYGKQLFDILKEIDLSRWDWKIGGGEAYIIENGALGQDLFGTSTRLTGDALLKRISENDYYLIFADLKAYNYVEFGMEIKTYDDFFKSECQFILLLVDSSYISIYSKNKSEIQSLHDLAITAKYEHVTYITDENDENTTLIAF